MLRLALAAAAVVSLSPASFATDPAPEPPPVMPAPEKSPALTLAPAPKAWSGFRIQSADKAYQLRLGGQLQLDALGFVGDEADVYSDPIRVRRARLIVRATVARYYDVRIQMEFAGSSLSLLDAVFETTWIEALRLRIGKDKQPIGFDRLQSDTASQFLEKSHSIALTPTRDLGIQLVGDVCGVVDYQLGVWNGAADGANNEIDIDDGFDLVARVTFRPFAHAALPALHDLLVGLYGSWGEVRGTLAAPQLSNYRSAGRAQWLRWTTGADLATTAIADGARVRFGGHLNWQYGPVGLFGEYMQSHQAISLGDTSTAVANSAYIAQATWLVTGDDAAWRGVKPDVDFDPVQGGSGAIELAVRWSALLIDDAAFDARLLSPTSSARGSQSLTVGVNWYLNAWVKLQLDYERTSFDGGAGDADRPVENLIGTRVQALF